MSAEKQGYLRSVRPVVTERPGKDAMAGAQDIFFAAIQTTRMPMIVTNPRKSDNPIEFANNAFLQMTGYAAEEVLGFNCRFLQGPETDPDTVRMLREAIAERREISTEILNYRKDGSAFWNALFVSPVYDADGHLIYYFASQLDISRRHDAEEALRQAQKMEAIGQLTGGIAHDFNNLLTITAGYLDLLQKDVEIDAKPNAARALKAIRNATERGATLTQQLLSFARKQRLQGRPISLNGIAENAVELAKRTLGATVQISERLADELWTTTLDPVQTELAILNVLINARDAMPKGGSILIETNNRELDELQAGSLAGSFGEIPPGRYAVLSITDTGSGMTPEVLARATEPFFTTKEVGKGTGLGLSMVYGFAKQSGGALRIYSEPEVGTTVRLYFPAAQPNMQSRPQLKIEKSALHGNETILIVDDRPEVAEIASLMLAEYGYTTAIAGNGREALEKLDAGLHARLLFSDIIMPGGMNGVMLAREVRKRYPDTRILLTTGYSQNSLDSSPAGRPEFAILSKPYSLADLARRVREVLDQPAVKPVS